MSRLERAVQKLFRDRVLSTAECSAIFAGVELLTRELSLSQSDRSAGCDEVIQLYGTQIREGVDTLNLNFVDALHRIERGE